MKFTVPLALFAALLIVPAHADEKTVAPGAADTVKPAAPGAADAVKPADSRAWLDARGVLAVSDLEKTLDTQFTGDERAKMEALLAQRNAALVGFNERVTQLLRDKLAASDVQVAARVEKKVDADKEAAELERIRRHQPSRYQELINRKNKAAAAAQKEAPK